MPENTGAIVRATPADAETAARLILMAYGDFTYTMLGCKHEAEATACFAKLWPLKNNRFSHEHSFVAKADGKPVAVMTCHPGTYCNRLIPPTVFALLKTGRAKFLWHLLTHLRKFLQIASTVEAGAGEFYIATLAVLPEHRGLGTGAKMLRLAKALARKHGLYRCSLLVEAGNTGGIRFYERHGFAKAGYTGKPHPYFRMVAGTEG